VPALGGAPSDADILAAVEALPDPVGGFATLVLAPHDVTAAEASSGA
jgi:hypothetical protein